MEEEKDIREYSDELLRIVEEFRQRIIAGTSDPEHFLSISEIEKLWSELRGSTSLLYSDMLTDLLSETDETELIRKKKTDYREKGIELRTNRKYSRSIMTINGWLNLHRYVLRPKGKIDAERLVARENVTAIVPLDDFLKISRLPFKMTPEVMLNVAFWAQGQCSYQEAEESILRAHRLKINDDTIRKVTNYIGNLVFQEDCKQAEEAFGTLIQGKLQFPTRKKKGILYIEADGAALNTRTKDESGSSWRENKLGIVFSSDNIHAWTDRHGEKQHQILKREYVSYIGSVSEFKKHLFSCALKNGYGVYEKTVMISDGAAWIRNLREELFPDTQQILDYYHLCENVNTFAKHYFGMDPSQYTKWASDTCTMLKESRYVEVLEDLENKKRPPLCPVDLHGYIQNNADHIDYAHYIKEGLFIGSGAVESGNKSILQQRLKQAGMRWNPQTAQYLLTLRTKHKSHLWLQEVERPVLKLLQ